MATSFLDALFRRTSTETGSGAVDVPIDTPDCDREEAVVHRRRRGDQYRPVTVTEMKSLYERPDSFTDLLPWVECDDEHGVFVLEDGRSCGVLFELTPIPTEARSKQSLDDISEKLRGVLTQSVPEIDVGPWVFQLYAQYEPAIGFVSELESYYHADAGSGSEYTEAFVDLMREHLKAVSRPEGLFDDVSGSGGRWRGRILRLRMVLYRRQPRNPGEKPSMALIRSANEMNETANRLEEAFISIGLRARRGNAKSLYRWLLPWFNPRPSCAEGDPWELMRMAPCPTADEMPVGRDLGALMTLSMPWSDAESGTWQFDGVHHRVITIQGQRSPPVVGHLTGERKIGSSTASMLDRMPEGTVVAMTIVAKPQDRVSNQVSLIAQASAARGYEAEAAAEEADDAKRAMARGEKLYPVNLAVYVRGDTGRDLIQKTNRVEALLVANGLSPINSEVDLLAMDAYIRNLPMSFNVEYDRRFARRARLTYSKHIAAMAPVYGRDTGTGHPGFTFFNRGGEPVTMDPLNMADRKKNGHLLLFGPTGAGKSATIVYLLMQMMAVYRPRIFIIDAGNSFGLLGQYFSSLGLSVHQILIATRGDVSLPPFADAIRVIEDEKKLKFGDEEELAEGAVTDLDEDDEQRDMLGEMEIAAIILITGGDPKEEARLTRADKLEIRKAILRAAEVVLESGGDQVITEDVVDALREAARDPERPPKASERIEEMASGLELNCSGLGGRLFNRPGNALPESDVTILDFGIVARKGYEHLLTPAYVGVMNRINGLVEKYQYDERPTIVVTDEGHVITSNPMLSPYVVKITKMWRKLGTWFWIGTQNVEDFPDAAKKMLNMIEWWLMLAMPKEEVEAVSRFKELTPEQKAMLISAKKQPGKYVEGVAITDDFSLLFRNVVPSLCLALAQTEKHEKAARARIMKKRGCTELEAAFEVAKIIDAGRGIRGWAK